MGGGSGVRMAGVLAAVWQFGLGIQTGSKFPGLLVQSCLESSHGCSQAWAGDWKHVSCSLLDGWAE